MADADPRLNARAWARVARTAAAAHEPASRSAQANRELFDAIEFAATVARLDLRELVDAYLTGVPELDMHEAWTEIEDYLERIADLQGLQLHRVVALPEWRERLAVVEILDTAAAAGTAHYEIDAFVRQLRSDQCDIVSVVAAVSWVAGERGRAFGSALPEPAWATVEEIARDRGAPVEVVWARIDDALARGLLQAGGRGVTVTPAGRQHTERAAGAGVRL